MRTPRALAGLVVAGLAVGSATAGGEGPAWSPPVQVAAAPAATRLELEDRRTVRLAGIRVPDAVASAAGAELARLVVDHAVRMLPAEVARDRYGRLVAQIERVDGLWLQGALLERGLAVVQTRPGETARAGDMLAIEGRARSERTGLWRDAAFAPRSPVSVHDDVGSFQIVAGRVRRVAPTDHSVYLNFGEDWRSDFTIRFRRSELGERFDRSLGDLEALAGRRVEVRGFVVEAGGPLIEVSHPEQIEVLP